MRYFIYSFLMLVMVFELEAQRATSAFSFQELSHSARATGLGQHTVALYDRSADFVSDNPALIHDSVYQRLAFQHAFMPAEINYGSLFFASPLQKYDLSMVAGLSYMGHGDITRADEFGNIQGVFNARAFSAHVGLSKRLYERVKVGIAFNYLQETIDVYTASGMAMDLGILYQIPDQKFTIGLSWQDIGWQWSPFHQTTETIRSNLQIGLSKELEHLPFRFSIVYHHINHWDLRYESDVDDQNLLVPEDENESDFSIWTDNFFRHFAVNGEFFIGKKRNLMLRLGYNHQLRQELQVANWNSLAGFSFGAGANIKGFVIDYGFQAWHLGGGINHIGVQMDIGRWFGNDHGIL